MGYQTGWMDPEERSVLESWAKLDKVVKDFTFVWTRWKSWDDFPPVVVRANGAGPVGFHAAKFTKSGYINSAFQFVLAEHRGKRLAGDMVKFFLEYGIKERNANRLRFRCPVGEDGDVFWQGFGMKPIGAAKGEHWYDLSLESVQSLSDLIDKADGLCDIVTTDKRTLTHYRKSGVDVINPVWHDVLPVTVAWLVTEMLYDNCMVDCGETIGWREFVDLHLAHRLDWLKDHFKDWDFDKLQEQAAKLSQEEGEVLVCGEEMSILQVVDKHSVEYLDKFLNDAFNWDGS